jgi:ubiquinone biosynthesis protein
LKQIQLQQQQHSKQITKLVVIATLVICLTISFI